MTFKDYIELKERAEKAGIKDSPTLKQLLHLIQGKKIASEYYKRYMNEMNEWEKNIAKSVEQEIKGREEHGD